MTDRPTEELKASFEAALTLFDIMSKKRAEGMEHQEAFEAAGEELGLPYMIAYGYLQAIQTFVNTLDFHYDQHELAQRLQGGNDNEHP